MPYDYTSDNGENINDPGAVGAGDGNAVGNNPASQGQPVYGNYVYTPEGARPDGRGPASSGDGKKGGGRGVKFLSMGLGFLLGSGLAFMGAALYQDLRAEKDIPAVAEEAAEVPSVRTVKSSSLVESDVSDIVEASMPSMVSVNGTVEQELPSFFGMDLQEASTAGSGILIGETETELIMATNYHVVQGASELSVTFADGESAEADIKGTDPAHDIAVISTVKDGLEASTLEAVSVAALGDSGALKPGEPAIAIGNALGYGQSVTTGIISAVGREVESADESGRKVGSAVKMIQTDAAINEGNSGGALLNSAGEVIGINSAKISGTTVEGMGYAIPVNDVADILDDLMGREAKHEVPEGERGYLGIAGFTVDDTASERYHMPVGVFVDEVSEGGPAEKAGLTRGNIITKVDGSGVTTMETLQEELACHKAGETVTVEVQVPENSGEYSARELEVTLTERPVEER